MATIDRTIDASTKSQASELSMIQRQLRYQNAILALTACVLAGSFHAMLLVPVVIYLVTTLAVIWEL
jgi:hypothetical protein